MAAPPDHFFTIEGPSFGEYKEKGSKFLAYAFRMDRESDFVQKMESVKAEHPKARHYCYAWKIGTDNNHFRANDDGEPSGSAGRPILNQILSHGLTNILIIVVRYFGGTKLGVPGLIKAYKEAAEEALNSAVKAEDFITDRIRLEFSYDEMGHILNVIKSLDLDVAEKRFDEHPHLVICVRRNESEHILILLKAALLKVSTEQVSPETQIAFCKIEREE